MLIKVATYQLMSADCWGPKYIKGTTIYNYGGEMKKIVTLLTDNLIKYEVNLDKENYECLEIELDVEFDKDYYYYKNDRYHPSGGKFEIYPTRIRNIYVQFKEDQTYKISYNMDETSRYFPRHWLCEDPSEFNKTKLRINLEKI